GAGCATEEKSGTRVERPTAGVGTLVAKALGEADQVDRLEVEDWFGLGVISDDHMVARHERYVLHAEGRSAEKVTLHGDPVPVAAGEGRDRLDADGLERRRGRQARHVVARTRMLGDRDDIDDPAEAATDPLEAVEI